MFTKKQNSSKKLYSLKIKILLKREILENFTKIVIFFASLRTKVLAHMFFFNILSRIISFYTKMRYIRISLDTFSAHIINYTNDFC